MNGTNVDYYVSGFDTAGKRVGSIICDFDPNKDKNVEKLAALKEKRMEHSRDMQSFIIQKNTDTAKYG